MRPWILCAAAVALVAAGFLFVRAAENHATAAPPGGSAGAIAGPGAGPGQAPASLVGQEVRVYFRGSDDIAFPTPPSGQARPAMTLTHLGGKVLRADAGWIELENREQPGRSAVWIPSASVAYVIVNGENAEPAAQP